MSSIILAVVSFFLQAFALKLALGVMGQPSHQNKYGTAIRVAATLALAGFLLGFIPLVGWLVYAILWLLVVRSVYGIGLTKSVGVAVLQVVIRLVLSGILALIGWG